LLNKEDAVANDDDFTDDKDDDDFQTKPDDVNPLYQMKKDEELPGDYDTPFSPPSGVQDSISRDDPRADSDVDPMDDYDEGVEGATNSDLPQQATDEEPEQGEKV
jgi:hypothetical protein